MTHRLQPQPGFALPLLLLLLTLGAIGSVAAVSVAMQQVRTTSILNASIQAIHAAESGGAYMVAAGSVPGLPDGEYEGEALAALSQAFPTAEPGWPMGSGRWWIERLVIAGQTVTLRVVGEDAAGRASRRIEITYTREETTQLFPFENAVLGCSGIDLRGSGLIDSWDSRNGRYGPGNIGSNANVSILDGSITLPGSTRIRGNLHANGDVTFSGSSAVEGSIWAVGNINFSGNPRCPTEELLAGGAITTPGAWWENGCAPQWPFAQEYADVPPPEGDCDPVGVGPLVDDQLQQVRSTIGPGRSGNFSSGGNSYTFNQDTHFNNGLNIAGNNDVFIESESVNTIYVDGDFRLGGGGDLVIRAPTSPDADGVVRIFVNGNVDFGGGSDFVIEPGAGVEIYVNGTTRLGAGLTNHNEAPTMRVGEDGVAPTFAIFSSHSGSDGVTVSGSADIFASVYAPNADISVTGGGDIYGALRGRTIDVRGGAGIHFDEALGGVSTGSTTESGGTRVTVWSEV